MRHVPHVVVPAATADEVIPLSPEQLHHVRRVLRREDGSPITYTDGEGLFGQGKLIDGVIRRGDEEQRPPGRRLTLAVAPPDSKDRMRFLVEKLAELGVARIVWLATRRGQGRPPRAERASGWAMAALEQSRGAWLTEVGEHVVSFDDLARPLLVAAPGGDPAPDGADVTVAIGPEGGWAPDEIPADAVLFDLGPTILRVETAAIVAAARLL